MWNSVSRMTELKKKYPCGTDTYEMNKAKSNFDRYECKKKKAFRLSFGQFMIVAAGPDWMSPRYNLHSGWVFAITPQARRIFDLCLSSHSQALLTAFWLKKFNGKKPKQKDTANGDKHAIFFCRIVVRHRNIFPS